ncbi:interleukin 12Ba [Pungitius pungitius]|uniref:interleukin 12Ba n=1 Tax=Pungitius pungitius TaxID=134920 RepID=UPI002E155639
MNSFVFGFLCASLHVTYQNPTRQWSMTPHVLLVGVDGSSGRQSLSCLERPRDGEIFWRKNGEEEAQRGNAYVVELKEMWGGGNYTCHGEDGSLLNHTEVLIQDHRATRRILVKPEHGDHLHCAAQNHNGEFRCSWTWHSLRVGKVAFIKARRASYDSDAECSVDAGGQRWTCSSGQSDFGCSVDDGGGGISCRDQQHCPYGEEGRKIHLTVYVRTEDFLVESYSKNFYLSRIVKPDKVTARKVNTTLIEWSYPSSWSGPSSYFPLTFQVTQFEGRRERCPDRPADRKASEASTVHSACQLAVKRKVKAVCIRAKDALRDSPWSDWSPLRSVASPVGGKQRHPGF